MDQSLMIRPFELSDLTRLTTIYTTAFSSMDGPHHPLRLAAFTKATTAENTLVAVLDDIVVGGGTYSRLTEGSDEREQMETTLSWAREKSDRDDELLNYCQDLQNDFGGEIVIEFFDNEFTNATFPVQDTDVYLDNLCVDQRYQGRGIGLRLVEERIRRAREQGATMVYTSCVENSPVVNIFRKLPFLPLLRLGPSYANGSAALEMAMRLRS